MTTFRIEYNPFAGECRFKKQGKLLARDSRLRLKEEERLQALFDKYNDWDGLIEEIKSECDDSEITIEFVGRKIDFEDIVYALKRYEGQNSDNSVTIDTRLIETDKKLEIVNRLDVIIDEIKGKNLPEFQRKNEEGLTVFDIYERVKRGIFELTVVATMSSGKSTLINALLGKELLPSKNEACTASITRIFDNDTCDGFVAECFDKNGATVYSGQEATLEGLRKMNDDERVHTIRIDGDIPFLSSERVKVCINDTPGPNNSRDENHGVLTNDFNGRSTMSPDEARIWKSNFERAMRTAEENIEAELFRKVDEGVFAQGKSLLHEYRRAVSSILGKFDGSSFNFSANLGASHKISLSEIDNKIAKNTTSETHTRYVTDTSKAWYKPWTWFKPRLKEEYYSVNVVKISEVVKDCLNLFTTSAYANIDLMIENARAQVRSYKDHFTRSIKSLEKDIAERVKQVKQRTANRDKIQAQVERDRSFKSWIDSCSQGLNAVVGFDMKEI